LQTRRDCFIYFVYYTVALTRRDCFIYFVYYTVALMRLLRVAGSDNYSVIDSVPEPWRLHELYKRFQSMLECSDPLVKVTKGNGWAPIDTNGER